jgi:hypothetical protein
MIALNRIEFANRSSVDFDILCDCAFDSDNGETSSFLNREAVVSENYRGTFRRIHNFKYTDVFSPKFTFVKKDFSEFSIDEVRRIQSWLTSKTNASFLTAYYDDNDVVSWEALGGWVDIQLYKIANRRTVGIVATFESATPWAFSPLYSVPKHSFNNEVVINLETDEPESPIYPRITIQQSATTSVVEINRPMTDADNWIPGTVFHYGNTYYWVDTNGVKHTSTSNTAGFDTTSVSIKNTVTDAQGKVVGTYNTLVQNNIKDETIVLDGANRVVSSSRPTGRIFGDDFDWQWLPLFEGTNTLSFVGNCTATIEYRHPIKCGEF